MTRISFLIGIMLVSVSASGHHSIGAIYDNENPRELTGTVSQVRWMNPHMRFSMNILDENDQPEVWMLETGSLNTIERMGVNRDVLEIGDKITVVGYPSRKGRKEMIVGHITLASGEKVVLWSRLFGGLASSVTPRDERLRESGAAEAAEGEAEGLFRVWTIGETYSRDVTDKGTGDMALPYRSAALASRVGYDPITDDTGLRCIQQGMPGIMDNPFPIELSEQNGNIVLRTEQWDVVRIIHMDGKPMVAGQSPTNQGYSTGYWEQDDVQLVVTTKNIDWPYFDDIGTPQSADIETVETFKLIADETQLDYTLTVTDLNTFTAPFTLDGYWVWVPGEEIKPYNCEYE